MVRNSTQHKQVCWLEQARYSCLGTGLISSVEDKIVHTDCDFWHAFPSVPTCKTQSAQGVTSGALKETLQWRLYAS